MILIVYVLRVRAPQTFGCSLVVSGLCHSFDCTDNAQLVTCARDAHIKACSIRREVNNFPPRDKGSNALHTLGMLRSVFVVSVRKLSK